MAAPTFVASGGYLAEGNGATAAFDVPAGVAANDVILAILYKENTATVTPPAGFTQLDEQAATNHDFNSYVFWKRATGGDAGTYSFSWTGSVWRTGFAVAYRGCVTSGSPVDAFNGATSGSTDVTTSPAVSVTTTGADRLLVWMAATWDVSTWGNPSGFTGFTPSGAPSDRLTTEAYKTQAAAGASGSVSVTTTQSFTKTAHLVALSPPAAAASIPTYRIGGQARRRAATI